MLLIRAPFRFVQCLMLYLCRLQARSIDPAIIIKVLCLALPHRRLDPGCFPKRRQWPGAQGGTVVNSDGVTRVDVLIQNGKISAVGPGLKVRCRGRVWTGGSDQEAKHRNNCLKSCGLGAT